MAVMNSVYDTNADRVSPSKPDSQTYDATSAPQNPTASAPAAGAQPA